MDGPDAVEGAEKYGVFIDMDSKRSRVHFHPTTENVSGRESNGREVRQKKQPTPSLEEVTTFYRDVFRRAKMESDCIIMSLVYVERLIKMTGGELRPRADNWRSILFSCMVLSSKVWDDLSMWNADFR